MMKFPEDFKLTTHPTVPNAIQYKATKSNGTIISIVGGGNNNFLHGDGINTFEMWDMDEEYQIDYQTKEELNEYLEKIE